MFYNTAPGGEGTAYPSGVPQSPSEKTDNTIAIRKGINGQTTIYKTLHRKQKIEQHQPL
jgi:hypothetical protein